MAELKSYLRSQIQEIAHDRVLQLYGAMLCLMHTLTAADWFLSRNSEGELLCWPGLGDCRTYAALVDFLGRQTLIFFAVYGAFSVLAAFFFFRRQSRPGWIFLIGLTILRSFYQMADYLRMGNYHYIATILCLIFLFIPQKKEGLKIFLVLFYLSSAFLKFNTDWLSGITTLGLGVPPRFLPLACAYVIVLEAVFVFFLFSKNMVLFWSVLAQFFLFHAVSWNQIGFFFPTLMFLALSLFLFSPAQKISGSLAPPLAVAIVLYGSLQLYPLIFEPRSALNGRGRTLSLNLFDGRTVCQTSFFIKKSHEIIEYHPEFPNVGVRIHCDPIVVLSRVQRICSQLKAEKDFVDLDLVHQARRLSDANVTEELRLPDLCSHPRSLNALGEII